MANPTVLLCALAASVAWKLWWVYDPHTKYLNHSQRKTKPQETQEAKHGVNLGDASERDSNVHQHSAAVDVDGGGPKPHVNEPTGHELDVDPHLGHDLDGPLPVKPEKTEVSSGNGGESAPAKSFWDKSKYVFLGFMGVLFSIAARRGDFDSIWSSPERGRKAKADNAKTKSGKKDKVKKTKPKPSTDPEPIKID